MIGNDVVDLATAKKESNWKRKGFLAKLFTTFEQEVIKNAINQEEMVWMLWSIKESTYKAYQRIQYNRGFYPIKIEIRSLTKIKNQYHSEVLLFGVVFFGKSCIKNQIISTVVVKNRLNFDKLTIQNELIYSKDTNGLPFCKITKKPISVSHHGDFKRIVQLNNK